MDEAKRRYPLEEYPLSVAGRDWVILNTQLIFTRPDEKSYYADVGLPYGVALWPSAIALAHALSARADALAGKSVLELGAGTGLPGLVAAHLGARVTQTDYQEVALWVCGLNAEANQVSGIEYQLVDWTDYTDERQYDLIIGADILYDEEFHDDLRRIFGKALARGGEILIADPLRASSMDFFDSLSAQGWDIDVDFWDLSEGGTDRRVGVLDLKPPH